MCSSSGRVAPVVGNGAVYCLFQHRLKFADSVLRGCLQPSCCKSKGVSCLKWVDASMSSCLTGQVPVKSTSPCFVFVSSSGSDGRHRVRQSGLSSATASEDSCRQLDCWLAVRFLRQLDLPKLGLPSILARQSSAVRLSCQSVQRSFSCKNLGEQFC